MKKIFFSITLWFLFIPISLASIYYGPPDGKNIIDIGSPEGYLFKVEKGVFVQTHSEDYILGIAGLFEQLKRTRTGKAIIDQVSSYQPISLPTKPRALAFSDTPSSLQAIEHIHVVIRPPSGGKRFVTEPLISHFDFAPHQSNGLGVPSVIYFDIENTVLIPGSSRAIEPAVALGHELIHARDYLSGGLPVGSQKLRHRAPQQGVNDIGEEFEQGDMVEFNLMLREFEATGLSYQKGITKPKELTATRRQSIELRESLLQIWDEARINKTVSKADYKRVRTNIALLKSEKAVSEYHLSLELESDTRDMYWPGNMISYSSVPAEITSSNIGSAFNSTSGVLSNVKINTRVLGEHLSQYPNSVMLISSSLIEQQNGFPRLNKALKTAIEVAVKLDRPIVFLQGDHFSTLSSSKQAMTIAMLEKAISSLGGNQKTLTMVSHEQGELGGTGRYLVRNSSQVSILSARDEMATLEISESLANSSQKLLVSRLGGIVFKPNVLPFQQRLRWSSLSENDNVTLISNSELPKSKKCWGL